MRYINPRFTYLLTYLLTYSLLPLMTLMPLMLCTACAINQSSDSQDLGRYLGFRLRCLDVDAPTSRPAHPHPAAAAAAAPLFDVTARLPDCPYDGAGAGGGGSLQSPVAGPVWRGPASVDLSPSSHRRMTSLPRSLKRDDADDVGRCNVIVNSRTDTLQ